MSVARRFRDAFVSYTPAWLLDRVKTDAGAGNVGYRFLWTMIAALDFLADMHTQGIQAWFPGKGTPTALTAIGKSRGMIKGRLDTDETYAERLRTWLDRWPEAGRQIGIARAVWDFVGGGVTVRVVSRGGQWTSIDPDGEVTYAQAAFDWDSITNPERAGYWSEFWVIVLGSPYAHRPGTLATFVVGDDGEGVGHLAPHIDDDSIRSLIHQWKAARSKCRAFVWCLDDTLFDPENPSSLPDGKWGTWGLLVGGSYVASSRDLTKCRFWEGF